MAETAPSAGRLAGRAAIVTGGSRGIGRAIARGYLREGARVVLTSRNDAEARAAAERLAGETGGAVLGFAADVSSEPAVDDMLARTLDAFGGVDVLVNNAGFGFVHPSATLPTADWQRVLDTNLNGSFYCARAVGQEMLRIGRGSIINIGSLTSFVGFPYRAAYGATKAAVVELTRVLACEWGSQGVRVNAIAPGWIRSDFMVKLFASGVLDEGKMVARTPLGRVGTPEDVVGPAVFLASDDAAFVTGTTLTVDGGWLAYGYL
ncbi:MAG: glucose 1-dehydrogenase [Chloroflexi bacterium]|nr:glucose 1-dehydrogenase [Chloroflexota bacterium]